MRGRPARPACSKLGGIAGPAGTCRDDLTLGAFVGMQRRRLPQGNALTVFPCSDPVFEKTTIRPDDRSLCCAVVRLRPVQGGGCAHAAARF